MDELAYTNSRACEREVHLLYSAISHVSKGSKIAIIKKIIITITRTCVLFVLVCGAGAFMSNCKKSSKAEAVAALEGAAGFAGPVMRKSKSKGDEDEGELEGAAGVFAAAALAVGAVGEAKKLPNGSSEAVLVVAAAVAGVVVVVAAAGFLLSLGLFAPVAAARDRMKDGKQKQHYRIQRKHCSYVCSQMRWVLRSTKAP